MMSEPAKGNYRVLAPGKLVLLGEYAILEGAPALVLAVDQYVTLEKPSYLEDNPAPLIQMARDVGLRSLGKQEEGHYAWRAQSDSLKHEGQKLGLGSSAAVAVATAAQVFHSEGLNIEDADVRLKLWQAAFDAHHQYQGSGSGIDAAASVFGGITLMQPGESQPRFTPWSLPQPLVLSFIWTGASSSTASRLEALRHYKQKNADDYDQVMSRMKAIVESVKNSFDVEPVQLIDAFADYGQAMDELGEKAGIGIVTPTIKSICRLAKSFGGAAKPSGAGGGDFVIGLFENSAAKEAFEKKVVDVGGTPFDFHPAWRGVHVEDLPTP